MPASSETCSASRFHVYYVDDWNGKAIQLTNVPVCEPVARAMVREENERLPPNSSDYAYYTQSEAYK